MAQTQSQLKDAVKGAALIRKVGGAARRRFVGMGEVISAVELALVCGEHVLIIGTFGTAKSAVARFFGIGLGLEFYRRVLNPDTTRDEIIGTIDPAQLQSGVWSRRWAGFATCQIGFADEFGKGGSQVQNMFVDLMEERLVSDSYGDREVPLHSLVAATNELFEEDSGATWDRFALRVEAKLVSNGKDFIALLGSSEDEPTVIEEITQHDLNVMRHACKTMAANIGDEVRESMVRLWSKLPYITEYRPSNRRWKKLLRVAAANALLDGRDTIQPIDLSVGSMMLWSNISEKKETKELVEAVADPDAGEIASIQQVIDDTAKSVDKIVEGTEVTVEAIATTNLNIDKLIRHCKPKVGTRWAVLREKLDSMKDIVSEHLSM